MKRKLSAILTAALFGLLLGSTGRVCGQTTDDGSPTITLSDLKLDQRRFTEFLRDGQNEYMVATNRLASQNELWVNNLAKAKVLVKINLTLMDGNSSLQSEDARIAALHRTFFTQSTIDRYSTAYRSLRTQTYALEDSLRLLMDKLTPAERRLIQKWLDQIDNSKSIDDALKVVQDVTDKVSRSEDQGSKFSENNGNDNGNGGNDNSNGGYNINSGADKLADGAINGDADAQSALYNALVQSGLSPEDAHAAVDAAAKGDLATILRLLHKYPDNKYLQALVNRLSESGDDPLTPEETKQLIKAAQDGDLDTIRHILQNHPNHRGANDPDLNDQDFFTDNYQPHRHGHQGGSGNNSNDQGDNLNNGGNSGNGGDISAPWSEEEKRDGRKDAHYLDFVGGHIGTEKLFIWPDKVKPADEIDWVFSIKPGDEQPTADGGKKVTYELVNDDPANADFEITAWEGPDGKTPSSERKFTVTFPKPGEYTVKVYGQTSKYHHDFVIPLSVTF